MVLTCGKVTVPWVVAEPAWDASLGKESLFLRFWPCIVGRAYPSQFGVTLLGWRLS
jgi:hypothetical protein